MDRESVGRLWEAHKQEQWPRLAAQLEGPLMTLDTVTITATGRELLGDRGRGWNRGGR